MNCITTDSSSSSSSCSSSSLTIQIMPSNDPPVIHTTNTILFIETLEPIFLSPPGSNLMITISDADAGADADAVLNYEEELRIHLEVNSGQLRFDSSQELIVIFF
jgi:hypothetical protein